MPKIIKPLSPKKIEASRSGDKLYDGGGLMLHHRPSGREWFMRYTATRLREMAGQIFRFGVQTGRCERNPAADLVGALKSPPVQHRPAIPVLEQRSDVPEDSSMVGVLDRFVSEALGAAGKVTRSPALSG